MSYTAADLSGESSNMDNHSPQLISVPTSAYQTSEPISSLQGVSASIGYSPALDLLSQHVLPMPLGNMPGAKHQTGLGSVHLAGYGLGPQLGGMSRIGGQGMTMSMLHDDTGKDSLDGSVRQGEKQLCTFFLRTGTCAYGDRCKFKHPLDRPPPTLNSRGYPLRADEPECAHYLKKGWCAFGNTCKFHHPELAPSILNSYSLTQPTFVNVSAAAFPSAATALYSMPSSVPTLYYVPTAVSAQQMAGQAVPGYQSVGANAQAQMYQTQLGQATNAVYRQGGPPGGMSFGGMMPIQMQLQDGSLPRADQLSKAMQSLRLSRDNRTK